MMRDEFAGFISASVQIVKNAPPLQIDPATIMIDLELDSLHEVELLMMIEEKLKISIDSTQFNSCKTVSDLIDLMIRLRS